MNHKPMQRYGFRDSCVTAVAPMRLVEEAATVPLYALPAFVGSGVMGVGLDASGLQGLDAQVAPQFGLSPDTDDLYIFRQGFISRHLGLGGGKDGENLMPFGYLVWTAMVGGKRIDAQTLSADGALWRREVDLERGWVETAIVLHGRVRLRIRVFASFGFSRLCLEVGLAGYDRKNQPLQAPVPVEIQIGLCLALRDGRPIFDTAQYRDGNLLAEVKAREPYLVSYRWHAGPELTTVREELFYGLQFAGTAENVEQTFRMALDIDRPGQTAAWDAESCRQAHETDWKAFWSRTARIETGNVLREFLFNNSLYLLRSGHEYVRGASGALLLWHQPGWHGCCFGWDMSVVIDGLLRAGMIEPAADYIRWLVRVMRSEGRPFPWMMTYDGASPIPAENDPAVLVNLASAMTAVRVYRATGDEALFREAVWPICNRVCAYMLGLFKQEGDRFIMATPVGHDIGEMTEPLVNETFTAVWTVSLLAQSLALADKHHLAPDWRVRARDVVHRAFFEHDGEEYLHARGVPIPACSFASWMPFLLYPTEGLRFLDTARFNRTRQRYEFVDLYWEKQGDTQPVCYFLEALSDYRREAESEADVLIEAGLDHVHGPGYFAEVGPMQWGISSLPPYPFAHGAYLIASVEQIFAGAFWDDSVDLFRFLPPAWRSRAVQARNLHSGNGVVLREGKFGLDGVAAVLEGAGPRLLRCGLPDGTEPAHCTVWIDGCQHKEIKRFDARTIAVEVRLRPAGTRIEVRRAGWNIPP